MVVTLKLIQDKNDIENKLALIPSVKVSTELLHESFELVIKEFNALGASDQVAKGSVLVSKLLN